MDFTVGPSAGIAFFLVVFDVWVINQIKRALCRASGRHLGINWDLTPRIPDELWIVLSVAIPLAVCVAFGFDLVASITGSALDERVPPWMANCASGVLVGVAAQKTYGVGESVKAYAVKRGLKVPKTWKLREDEKPTHQQ